MKFKIFIFFIFSFFLFGCINEEFEFENIENNTLNETLENDSLGIPPLPPSPPEQFPEQFEQYLEPEPEEVCLTNEEYEEVTDPDAPVLSLPFDLEDYYPLYWGMIPFCADPWNSGNIHGAIDFELKPNAKVYSASDGIVQSTYVGQAEGSGEVISMTYNGYFIDYSGLTNLQVQAGDEVKKGDHIANVVQIPHGEYHVHMGISSDNGQECPIKYMDEEFIDALKEMFAQAHYPGQSEEDCVCNCEYMPS